MQPRASGLRNLQMPVSAPSVSSIALAVRSMRISTAMLRHRYGFLFVCLFAIMLWLTGCARSENDLENICLRRITTLAGNLVYSSRADYDRVIPTQKPESPRSAVVSNSISSRTAKIRHLATGQITHIAALPKMRWKGPVSTQRRHREH